MKLTIAFLMILIAASSISCQKNYTNEQCTKIVMSDQSIERLDRMDRSLLEIGASVYCSKYNNNPKETLKHIND